MVGAGVTSGAATGAAVALGVALVEMETPRPDATELGQPQLPIAAPAETTPPQRVVRTPVVSRAARRPDQRTTEPAWLAGCPSSSPDTATNGTLDPEALCELPDGHRLTTPAARAWWRLSVRYEVALDEPMCVTDSYRTLATQQSLRAAKPGLAAVPGTSTHGWANAMDLCGGAESFSSQEYAWLDDEAERWGWVNPAWATSGGSKPEPWHWEYVGG